MRAQEHPGASIAATLAPRVASFIQQALPGCRDETARSLDAAARVRKVGKEELVFRQGEPVPMTLIIRGYGAFRRTTVEGQHLIIGIANPGDVFGFSSVASVDSSVDLVAVMDCTVALWRGPDVRHLVTTDPGFALAIIDRMASFLNDNMENVDGLLHQNARRRVVRVLARHRDLFFASPVLLSRSHLPGLVGTSREMTRRVLRQLERERTLVRVGRTGLRLLQPDRLDADAAQRSPGAPQE